MVTRFAVTLPEREQFINSFRHLVALSPNGTRLAYVAGNRIQVRALDELNAVPVRGTEGLGDASPREVFFSPDGEWIGFFADGHLKKVPVGGGVPITLCVAQAPEGTSWERDNTILFGQEKGGIWRVSGDGGTPELLVKVDPHQRAHGPALLPDGKTILFTLAESRTNWDDAQIVVQSLDTGVGRTLINGGTDARYVPTGHLIYALRGVLLAVPFDIDSLSVNGSTVSVVENVWKPGVTTGTAQFAVSAVGTLAFIPGVVQQAAQRMLVWADRQGGEEPIIAPPRAYVYPRISPDGTRIALDVPEENRDIWVWTLARNTLTRLTFDAAQDLSPVWTPDGQRIIFGSDRSGARNLFWQAASGAGEPEQLTHSDEDVVPNTVSADGTRAVGRRGAGTGSDIATVTLHGDYQVEPLLDTKFSEQNPEISPEGRWIAYESNATGTPEIYVRPFPGVGAGQWQISTMGGEEPLWARNGRELFYRDREGAIMQVPVETGLTFSAGTPKRILDGRYYAGDSNVYVFRTYDISPDGRRFLMIREAQQAATTAPSIIVVQHWFEELRRLVPVN